MTTRTKPPAEACRRGHPYVPGSFALRTLNTGYVVKQCLRCNRDTTRREYAQRTPGYPKQPAVRELRAFLADELLPWLCPEHAPWRPGEVALAERVRALLGLEAQP
jgi:hypothetical protein